MGKQNSFNRTVGAYVKDLICSHINNLIQEIGVQKEDLKKTWIDCHAQTCTVLRMVLEVGNSSQAPR